MHVVSLFLSVPFLSLTLFPSLSFLLRLAQQGGQQQQQQTTQGGGGGAAAPQFNAGAPSFVPNTNAAVSFA